MHACSLGFVTVQCPHATTSICLLIHVSRYAAWRAHYPDAELIPVKTVDPSRHISSEPLPGYLLHVMDKPPAKPKEEYAFQVGGWQ